MSKRFSEELRILRKQNELSQQQVADALGIPNKSTVGSWEIGKGSPDPSTLVKLCFLYEVDFDHFARECGIEVSKPYSKKESFGTIAKDEQQLLQDYRTLSEQGQEYIRQTMVMAVHTYKKDDDFSDVEEIG